MKKRILIAGGGLAGATCGYLLQKEGFEVTVLERLDAQTKSKLCGGLMTPRSIRLANSIFGAPEMDELFGQEFHEMLCLTGHHTIMMDDVLLKSLHRKDLDSLALRKFVEAGGTLVDHCDVRHVDQEAHSVEASLGAGEHKTFSYDILIAADGAYSNVRQSVTGKAPQGDFCLEAEVDANPDQPLTMIFDRRFRGYFWYIPRGEGEGAKANVGLGAFAPCDQMEELLEEFSARVGVSYEKRRGAFLPKGDEVILRRGDVYFLGDAAALICPTTGEGIYYALRSARDLSRALSVDANYSALMQDCVEEVARQYKVKTQEFFYNDKLADILLEGVNRAPQLSQRVVKRVFKRFASF